VVGKVTFKIEGAKEMEALLKDLGPKVATRLGDKALRAAAKPIIQEAKRLVPVRTGQLKRSIVGVGGKNKQTEREVLIGFKPPASRRAHFTEFGTRHSAAHPFMRPALDARAQDALNAMVDTLAEGIEREEWKRAVSETGNLIEIK